MTDSDKARFVEVIRWLCRKFPVDGKPRPLPVREDLADYFEALRDLHISDLEEAMRWHYAHSVFYPTQPAALRQSVDSWRAANPQKATSSQSGLPGWFKEEKTPGSTELSEKMGELFTLLTMGKIDVDEYMRRLWAVCDEEELACE